MADDKQHSEGDESQYEESDYQKRWREQFYKEYELKEQLRKAGYLGLKCSFCKKELSLRELVRYAKEVDEWILENQDKYATMDVRLVTTPFFGADVPKLCDEHYISLAASPTKRRNTGCLGVIAAVVILGLLLPY